MEYFDLNISLRMLETSEGGRKNHIIRRYRPNVIFNVTLDKATIENGKPYYLTDGFNIDGILEFDSDFLELGKTVEAVIKFPIIGKSKVLELISSNRDFIIREGGHVVGEGVFLET